MFLRIQQIKENEIWLEGEGPAAAPRDGEWLISCIMYALWRPLPQRNSVSRTLPWNTRSSSWLRQKRDASLTQREDSFVDIRLKQSHRTQPTTENIHKWIYTSASFYCWRFLLSKTMQWCQCFTILYINSRTLQVLHRPKGVSRSPTKTRILNRSFPDFCDACEVNVVIRLNRLFYLLTLQRHGAAMSVNST